MGLTIEYMAESSGQSLPGMRVPAANVLDPEATMNEAVAPVRPTRQQAAPQVRIADEDRPIASPPRDPRTSPPPVVVTPSTRGKPSSGQPASNLRELSLSAETLAAGLRELNSELAGALVAFDQSGGRAALQAIVSQARRVEANPHSAQELEALVGWLPTVRRMLETELVLIGLLSRSRSDASE